jgi:hypothetical protein
MSNAAPSLPNDPANLRAMIAALEAENGQLQEDADRMAATLRAHEALVQALQIQIARLRKQKFGPVQKRSSARLNSWNWRWNPLRLRPLAMPKLRAVTTRKGSHPQMRQRQNHAAANRV